MKKFFTVATLLCVFSLISLTVQYQFGIARVATAQTLPGGMQLININSGPNSWELEPAILSLPDDYNSTTKSYPLLIFLHGVGEASATADPAKIYTNSVAGGPAYFIANGQWPSSFTNPADGQAYKFIVVSPQANWFSTTGTTLNYDIQSLAKTYRVDTSRIYLTGLSAGGQGVTSYITHYDYMSGNALTPVFPAAAAAPMSLADDPNNIPQSWVNQIIADNVNVWGFGSESDQYGVATHLLVSGKYGAYNSPATGLGSLGRFTPYSGGHCCWGTFYNPSYKETIGGKSMNLYEWMLQFKRGGTTPPPPPANSSPTANAGTDQTITLPTSSVSVAGSGSDSDGTIASYSWTKQSGTGGTIVSPTAATTTISGLTAGTYVYRLTVTDNAGATGSDDVTIIVNSAPVSGGTLSPYGGTARSIPGTIQVEDYDNGGMNVAYFDYDAINQGVQYRVNDGVDIESTTGGGYNLGWTLNGEWMKYSVNVGATGTYTLQARVAGFGGTMNLEVDGTKVATITAPSTGTFQTWQTINVGTVSLTAGAHVLRIYEVDNGFNFDWFSFTASGTTPTNIAPTANAGTDKTITLPTSSVSLTGTGTDTDGSIASYSWTKQSGTGGTIVSPTTASTTVSGLTQGTYVFRLTVTDNAGATAFDDVTVIVNGTTPVGTSTLITVDPANVINETVAGDESKLFNEQSTLTIDANGNPVASATNPVACPDIWNEVKGHVTCWSLLDNNGVKEVSWPARLTIDLKATYNVTDAYVYVEGASANGANDAMEVRVSNDPFNFGPKLGGSKLYGTYPYNQWLRVPVSANNGRYIQLTFTSDVGKIGEVVFAGTKTGTTVSDSTPSGSWQKQHYTMDTFIGTNVSFGMGDGYDKDYDYQWGTLRNYGGFRWTFDANDNVVPNAYASDTELRRIASGSGVKSFNAQMGVPLSMVDPADPNYNNGGDAFADRKPIDYTLCKGSVTVNGVATCLGVADKPDSYAHKAYLDKKYAQFIGSSSQYKQEFVELGNESDGSWNQAGYFNPYELAAMMSADYDGHCDTLRYNGEHVGIKAGDPNMKVLMPGLVSMGSGDMRYLNAMNFWWQHNRPCAQKIPADVINFHFYSSSSGSQGTVTGIGISPEDYGMRDTMKKTVDFRNKYAPNADVAVTEYGYDSYQQVFPDPTVSWCKDTTYGGSIIAARPIGSYDSDEVAGQWITRSILEMAAAGIDFSNQFWLGDEYKINTVCGTFNASGLLKQPVDAINWRPLYQPRPGWYYAQTLRAQLKGMRYDSDKDVSGIRVMKFKDVNNSSKVAYAVWSPTSNGYTNNSFNLSFDKSGTAQVIKLATGTETGQIDQTTANTVGSVVIPVSERVTIVRVNEDGTSFGTPTGGTTPIANAGNDQSITLPTSSVTLAGSGSDADGSIVSYSWTKTNGNGGTIVSPNTATTVVSGLTEGTYIFHLVVTDNSGATGSDDVVVIVNPSPNNPPTANAGADKDITLPINSVSLVGSGVDSDGTIASYAWTKQSGTGGTIVTPSSATTVVSGLTEGTYVYRLTVTDNKGSTASDDVNVVVNPVANSAPVVNAGIDQNITLPVNAVTLAATATDPNGDTMTYAWAKVSGGTAVILSATSLSTVVNSLAAGTYVFQFTATDSKGAAASDTMVVTVGGEVTVPNKAPTVDAGVNQSITLPTNSVTLSGTASDSDGTIALYAWTKTSGGTATIVTPAAKTTTVSGLAQGTYVFTLTVTDNLGATASDTVSVTVSKQKGGGGGGGGGKPPKGKTTTTATATTTAYAGLDVTIASPIDSVVLSGSATDTSGAVSYSWSKVSGSGGTIDYSNRQTTTVRGLKKGKYTFQLAVKNVDGTTTTDTVDVTVLEAGATTTALSTANTTAEILGEATSNIPTSGGTRVTTTASSLNVRTAPVSGSVTTRVPAGTSGTLLSTQNGWQQVQFDNGMTGWVSSTYTTTVTSAQVAPVVTTNATGSTARVTATSLNVRSAPVSGSVIAKLSLGTVVPVLSTSAGWSQVQLSSGATGWVSNTYLSVNSGTSVYPTTTTPVAQQGATGPIPQIGPTTVKAVITNGFVVGDYVRVKATSLSVRATPGGSVISKVQNGAIGTVVSFSGSWAKVLFNGGISGYVSTAYISKI